MDPDLAWKIILGIFYVRKKVEYLVPEELEVVVYVVRALLHSKVNLPIVALKSPLSTGKNSSSPCLYVTRTADNSRPEIGVDQTAMFHLNNHHKDAVMKSPDV